MCIHWYFVVVVVNLLLFSLFFFSQFIEFCKRLLCYFRERRATIYTKIISYPSTSGIYMHKHVLDWGEWSQGWGGGVSQKGNSAQQKKRPMKKGSHRSVLYIRNIFEHIPVYENGFLHVVCNNCNFLAIPLPQRLFQLYVLLILIISAIGSSFLQQLYAHLRCEWLTRDRRIIANIINFIPASYANYILFVLHSASNQQFVCLLFWEVAA